MERKIIKFLETTYKKKRKSEIIFVLSTGRCGSTSITKMFNQHPDFLAYHEDIPELIYLSTFLAEYPPFKEKVYADLKNIFQKKKWEAKRGQIIVHSDHKLWNMVEFLSDYFPNSNYIHLMRNPYDSVKSYLPRNWYTEKDYKSAEENPHAKYRLNANRIGVISDDRWSTMNQIEKCTWYWNYVNINIYEQFQNLSIDRSFSLQLENIEPELNRKLKEHFFIKKDYKLKNIVSNEREKKTLIDKHFDTLFYEALQKFGSESARIFYPSYL